VRSRSEEDIEHVATLARLSLTDEEKSLFGSQMNDILEYVEKLKELDAGQAEPTSHVLSLLNVLREDEPRSSLTREEALRNAPSRTEKFFRVPKIIE
jgi:aspartyl-tRNA(Asn)/glutamyl-tRNA(Gln) amidotransferase subunit C